TAALALLLRLAPGLALPAQSAHAGHAAHHLAHHLLALLEPDDQLIDFANRDARAGRDPGAARSVDDLRITPLLDGHRVHDCGSPFQVLVTDLAERIPVLRGTGQHAEQVADRAELADHGQLLDEVLKREALAGNQLAGHGCGLILVERPLRLLDQGQDVAEI